jgi:hypothetical protein
MQHPINLMTSQNIKHLIFVCSKNRYETNQPYSSIFRLVFNQFFFVSYVGLNSGNCKHGVNKAKNLTLGKQKFLTMTNALSTGTKIDIPSPKSIVRLA